MNSMLNVSLKISETYFKKQTHAQGEIRDLNSMNIVIQKVPKRRRWEGVREVDNCNIKVSLVDFSSMRIVIEDDNAG